MADRPYHHGDLRQAMLDATRRQLEAGGPDAVTIAKAALECGVSVAAPYRHFKDRAHLLSELAALGFREMLAQFAEQLPEIEVPLERFNQAGVIYINYAVAHPELFRIMFTNTQQAAPAEPDRPMPAAEGGRAMLEYVAGLVSGVFETERFVTDPETVLQMAWSCVHGIAMLQSSGLPMVVRDLDDEALLAQLRLVTRGLRVTEAATPSGAVTAGTSTT